MGSAYEHEVWPQWHQPNHYCVNSEQKCTMLSLFACEIINAGWNSQCLSTVFLNIFHSCLPVCSADTLKLNVFVSCFVRAHIFPLELNSPCYFRRTFSIPSATLMQTYINVWKFGGYNIPNGEGESFRNIFHGNIFTQCAWRNGRFHSVGQRINILSVSCLEFVKIVLMHCVRAYTKSHWDRMHTSYVLMAKRALF